MAMRIRRNTSNGLDAWPGYVDALSTLLMVIIFVLLVFVLAQGFLSASLSGRNKALDTASRELTELRSALAVEQGRSGDLQRTVTRLSGELDTATAARTTLTQQLATLQDQASAITKERDQLARTAADAHLAMEAANVANTRLQDQLTQATTQAEAAKRDAGDAKSQLTAMTDQLAAARQRLADMQRQIAELDRTVKADKETVEARVSDLARLTEQARALAALREQLQQQVRDATARALTEADKRTSSEAALTEQTRLSESARAEVALLNRQIEELRGQLSSIAQALELADQKNRNKDTTIADLGQKLNTALASKVEELQRYRSEFFGRLRTLLENRSGIQVVGDRFVFQSEVLFPVGSAELTQAGIGQMTTLAITIKEIANEIPPDVRWLLRVDGHTDPAPVRSGQFASNWELSAARAITVVKLLIAAGVPAERLAATGFGEFQPFGPGDTPDAYAKDRRIELRLTDR